MFEVNDFDAIRVSLASPEQIHGWSYGEVTKPETINYRTLKAERDGLFCESIFGPTKDFECACGKYKRVRFKGVVCDKCKVEIARAKVRRERMGHIDLACPVSHIWFSRGIPSRIGLLLDLSARNLERVIYFSHYIITSVNKEALDNAIKEKQQIFDLRLEDKRKKCEATVKEMEENGEDIAKINEVNQAFEDERERMSDDLATAVDQLKRIRVTELLTESQYREFHANYGDVFEAGMGAEAILKLLENIDLEEMRSKLIPDTHSTSAQRRRKVAKQLQLVEAFRRSGNKPSWMIITVLPVLPPDLRPMVQLDGGRWATSDLNDLYRRVINRNNRLRHLMEINAPSIIIRNEKRMLQEAVDSLIDNGRRGRAVSVSGDHKAKSLSDMLRGKQGRFRQNLLGKRVDYSGRSVIVCGPSLKLHQCGLPRRMALELFKPFVMHKLVMEDKAANIKSAKRLVDRAKPEVYDVLEEVVKERPVLLNRAPTLHRMSIQAFEPVLIDGGAIRLHPLVCSAFNADFDGDQMAVHVPLSNAAVREAREMMLSTNNMLLPSSGDPSVTPSLDMVLGCYYLTLVKKGAKGEGTLYARFEDVKLAYDLDLIDLQAEIIVRNDRDPEHKRIKTTAGRIIFNEIVPAGIPFVNREMSKGAIKNLIVECYAALKDNASLSVMLDGLKATGFKYATVSGISIAMCDVLVPGEKDAIIEKAKENNNVITEQFENGFITEQERYRNSVNNWRETNSNIENCVDALMKKHSTNSIAVMFKSGARGNISQITQMAGMRGLMTNPSGDIIDFPIVSSLREGLTTLEYFISTHGARKGLADTALRTSGSGYLTRRLVDVTQNVIVKEHDCGDTLGIWIDDPGDNRNLPPFNERIAGRYAASDVVNPETGEIIVERNNEITDEVAQAIIEAGIKRVNVRSPLSCQSRQGICQLCYGRDLARNDIVDLYSAVGIIAAQSIGEPGTQLTLRTFHTGGVAATKDITTGLPRVEELFEARPPKAQAIISEIDGIVTIEESDESRTITVANVEAFQDEYPLPKGWKAAVKDGDLVEAGKLIAAAKNAGSEDGENAIVARSTGIAVVEKNSVVIRVEEVEEKKYPVTASAHIRVADGQAVKRGEQLTDGSINPQDLLAIMGKDAVERYFVDEVQNVYCSQGVHINDKHIEVIVRQMLAKVRVDSIGDTELIHRELVDRYRFEEVNSKVLAEGGEPATAQTVLMGITRASLSTESWLAAASFQETTRVLTEAAIYGKVDYLLGLKENVIIGKLIPARCAASLAAEAEAAEKARLEKEQLAERFPADVPFVETTENAE